MLKAPSFGRLHKTSVFSSIISCSSFFDKTTAVRRTAVLFSRACLKTEELPNFSQAAGERKGKMQESFRISMLFNAASPAVCRKRRVF
ncbi:hypothetical protein FMM72_00310 [Anaerotruncus colihominis]|uniref:Uncharacterized protein n=1 Tax=Anaerotruncus colihominis TaxID=169435 RepID=A0A845STQ5_9FIRM|nr:hypothetical protein [Anaerotruncus colihominis]